MAISSRAAVSAPSLRGVWESVPGWPVPIAGAGGAFLLKDLFLLGAAVWITGESLRALAGRSVP